MAKFIYVFLLIITSCYGGENSNGSALTGKWRYENSSLSIVAISGTSRLPFLEFVKDGKTVSGFLGCNRFGARFSTKGDEIKFTAMMQTEMACDNMEIENSFAAFLIVAGWYKVENKKLHLFKSKDRKEFVVLKKIE
jgi:heat shock protein HslJ